MGMEQYTNYCTEELTNRAYELGAPIIDGWVRADGKGHDFDKFSNCFKHHCIGESKKGNFHLRETPTTQQMMNWLKEEQGLEFTIYPCGDVEVDSDICELGRFENELAAIDAALDYLEKGETK